MGGGDILTLDLATVCGWAQGPAGGKLASGVVRLAASPETPRGERYAALFRFLWDRLGAFRPAAIYYEAPLPPSHMRGHTNMDTASFLLGLPAIVHTVAQLRGVWRVESCNVQDVRAHFIGGRQFLYGGKPIVARRNSESKVAKHCTMERCRELGIEPATHDEADAVAIHSYASALLRPALGSDATPLFEGAPA